MLLERDFCYRRSRWSGSQLHVMKLASLVRWALFSPSKQVTILEIERGRIKSDHLSFFFLRTFFFCTSTTDARKSRCRERGNGSKVGSETREQEDPDAK